MFQMTIKMHKRLGSRPQTVAAVGVGPVHRARDDIRRNRRVLAQGNVGCVRCETCLVPTRQRIDRKALRSGHRSRRSPARAPIRFRRRNPRSLPNSPMRVPTLLSPERAFRNQMVSGSASAPAKVRTRPAPTVCPISSAIPDTMTQLRTSSRPSPV
jgi:hypothetical protein